MIRVENLCKTYPTRFGKKLVLDNVNFELKKGEKLGILGRNGAGKSTLIRLISGVEFATSGRVLSDMSVSWPLAFSGAFQDNLTGVDNVRFISRVYDQDFKHNLAFVEEFSELGDYLREEVRTYSSGMRARLAFAISMITEFDCFLIDEVSAVGDARFHARCNYELFERRADRAMIIVSHNTSYINNHCNKFALLHDAKLKLYDDFEEAYSDFKTKIGLADSKVTNDPRPKFAAQSRKQLIDTSNTSALHDEKFFNKVLEAHMRGEEKKWDEARDGYASALEIYPFQGSYWTQWAHMVKDGGDPELAEMGYRTACAFGESTGEVDEFFTHVLKKQKRFPPVNPLVGLTPGPAHEQPSTIPDVNLLAIAAWGQEDVGREELIALMREHPKCDSLFACLVEDERFAKFHAEWLVVEDGLGSKALKARVKRARPIEDAHLWAANLTSISNAAESERGVHKISQMIEVKKDALPILLAHGGFSDWPKSQAALRARFG
ncbi:ABC transporter ATP-binding protein [uncultured Erythrobacter sp.]|uniref:ABC transporter ATP-binding protein n=1 Tax=uncultured Erythrobacter sp. TaxID=263913 RepID=UPI00344B7F4D